MKQQISKQGTKAAIILAATLIASNAAQATFITSDPSLPPVGGMYVSPSGAFASYGNSALLQIIVQNPQLGNFTGVARTPIGPDEMESFNATFMGTADIIQANIPIAVGLPIFSSGLVTTLTHNRVGNVTGTFQTEMLSMNLAGVTPLGPFMIRESPTLPSLGQTTITDIGGGLFQIDSFFDVFTELSIDGGQTWIPANNGPGHLQLGDSPGGSSVPDGGSTLILLAGALGTLGWFKRRFRDAGMESRL